MSQITAKIIGESGINASFVLQHVVTGAKQVKSNTLLATFDTVEGEKYTMVVEVTGPDGKKYKLEIEDAQKATYPSGEQTIDDGRDFILARITA